MTVPADTIWISACTNVITSANGSSTMKQVRLNGERTMGIRFLKVSAMADMFTDAFVSEYDG